jgi:hypothetical protein
MPLRPPVSVCPSVRMEQLGSHWTDFNYTWYMNILQKSVERNEVAWKSQSNNGYVTLTPMYIYNNISLNSSWMKKCLRQKLMENENNNFTFNTFCFGGGEESCHLWDHVEKYGRPRQVSDDNTVRRMRSACWIHKSTHTHTHTHWKHFLIFHGNNGYANAPRCYVFIHSLPFSFHSA